MYLEKKQESEGWLIEWCFLWDRNEYWKWYSNIWYNYSNIFECSFPEIVPLLVREIVSLSGHWTYPDSGTSHNQFEVRKVRSGVSINYLSVLPVRRDVNMKVSTVSWKSKTVLIEPFVMRQQSSNFCSQLLFNRQQNFRLRSHDKRISYTDDLFKTLQNTDKFDCRMLLLSHCCTTF